MEKIFTGIEIAENLKSQLAERIAIELKETEKLATVNANKILDSVANQFIDKFGVQRLANETKITEFLSRAVNEIGEKSLKLSEKEISERDLKIKDLEEKIKAGITDENFRKEYDKLKENYGKLNDTLETEKKRIQNIENEFNTKLTAYKIDGTINSVMPSFDKDVNKYELQARKNETTSKLKENFNLKFNDNGDLIAENKQTFQTKTVSDFLNEELKDLLPKQQQGGGAKPPQNYAGGLIFTKEMNNSQKEEMIHSYLVATKGYKSKIDNGYAADFLKAMQEANGKIK